MPYHITDWTYLLPLVKVVDALNLNMEHKARNFESPFLAALFLLNNFQFLLKSLKKWVHPFIGSFEIMHCKYSNSKLLSLLEDALSNIEDHYTGVVIQQGQAYQKV